LKIWEFENLIPQKVGENGRHNAEMWKLGRKISMGWSG